MVNINKIKIVLLSVLLPVLNACEMSSGSSLSNQAPLVNAGADQTIDEQTNVLLTATASDTDGSIASYVWSQASGTDVTLTNADTVSASFTAPTVTANETLVFSVTVTDNEGAEATDTATVTINDTNVAPTAEFSVPLTIRRGDVITFDGSASSDPESSPLSYAWSQTDSSGINIVFDDETLEQPSFTAPLVTAATSLEFSLTVTDIGGKNHTVAHSTAITPDNSALATLNDTGFSTCGDYGFGAARSGIHQNNLDCSNANDDDVDGDPIPEIQDGQVGRDVTNNSDDDGSLGFSFIKLDSNGSPLPASAIEWSCVLDVVTNLVWEVKTDDAGLQDANHTYSWFSSDNSTNGGDSGLANGGACSDSVNCDTEKYTAAINSASLCAKTDWQVPSHTQLQSIIDFSQTAPAIDTNYFPNTVAGWYWSSSVLSANPIGAWRSTFDLNAADLKAPGLKSTAYSIRLVSKVNP